MDVPSSVREAFAPGRHGIDAYGGGGFRFAEMSHRGSILALPSGIRAWPVDRVEDIDANSLAPAIAEAAAIDLLLVGTGADVARLPADLRTALREAGIAIETMQTGAAARTYNVLLAERRRVAAALVAVP